MKWLFCIIFPPLAVLLCGRPFLAMLNALLTVAFWIPGALHAILVVAEAKRTNGPY